jgi:hypothetical protein
MMYIRTGMAMALHCIGQKSHISQFYKSSFFGEKINNAKQVWPAATATAICLTFLAAPRICQKCNVGFFVQNEFFLYTACTTAVIWNARKIGLLMGSQPPDM